MKNILKSLLFISLLLFLSQCNNSFESEKEVNTKELTELKQKLMVEVLKMSKNYHFREMVLEECLKQENGDYQVHITKIASRFRAKSNIAKLANELEDLVRNIKLLNNGREPIIFYPRAETIEDESKLTTKTGEYLQEPIGVFQEEIDGMPIDPNPSPSNPTYSSPGYIVDNGYNLVYYQHITEDYAWENDVWVIGEEENVSPENMIAAVEDNYLKRFEGQAEYAGIIQVTDLNAIEHWTSGKFEFRLIVFDAAGGKKADRKFGRWKRKHFKDRKWHDFNHFLFNWNTNNIGRWTTENWWEEDGGNSASFTISFPPPAGQTGPTLTATIPSKNRDDDLGIATIQFTDAITQVYNISFANIKRKN